MNARARRVVIAYNVIMWAASAFAWTYIGLDVFG